MGTAPVPLLQLKSDSVQDYQKGRAGGRGDREFQEEAACYQGLRLGATKLGMAWIR